MSEFAIHCLDVGAVNYGDSILCVIGGKTILIDGGAPGSSKPTESVVAGEEVSHKPIQDQVRSLLQQTGTPRVDLLIVTHCHSDHMGALPQLYADGKLKCRWALVADPQYGYGISADSDEPPPFDDMTDRDKLWLALREEPIFSASDAEIAQFIEDSAREYEQYVTFVNGLKEDLADRCVIYRGLAESESPGLTGLLSEFQSTGLHIYGPSEELLLALAARLEGRSDDLISDALKGDDTSLVEAYRAAVEQFADAEDGEDGAAVNCQSLVLRLGPDSHKALLTGDMQFAQPDVGEGTALVKALRAVVDADAPFAMVKLSHHAATNGQNKAILAKWAAPHLMVSTGSKSTKHPTEPTLQALESLESSGVKWARVDMNGRCSYLVSGGQAKLEPERLALNDDTRPAERSGDAGGPAGAHEVIGALPARSSEPLPANPTPSVEMAPGDNVKIQITLPHRRTKVSFTIEIDPGDPPGPFASSITPRRAVRSSSRPGDGSRLPRLLFVTDDRALAGRIGRDRARSALDTIGAWNQPLVTGAGPSLIERTQRAVQDDRDVRGVVILGGYEVAPSQIVNTLPRELAGREIRDRDRLQVWSDDAYGDRDRDGVPELPVSRIPDAGDPELIAEALRTSPSRSISDRCGLRNLRRPFADAVYKALPGARPMFTSAPTPPNLGRFLVNGHILYLMLHGSASNATAFTGEDEDGSNPVALSIDDIPAEAPPVVLAGCCYGALTVDTRARDAVPGAPVASRRVQDSIALSFLRAGANAFVGCTGVHYSPTQAPLTYFGEPLHRAFVQQVLAGEGPAQALWSAKVAYAAGIPHRPGARPVEIAYEHKILRQFTCLGLGW